jgi:hypothetical protein
VKVVVTGSRNWTDGVTIRAARKALPKRSTVICGRALGADTIAEESARLLGLRLGHDAAMGRDVM